MITVSVPCQAQSQLCAKNSLQPRLMLSSEPVSQVTEIALWGNTLTGNLPEAWGSLSRLTALDLHNNSLQGTLPPSWGNLSSLTTLDLSNTTLQGTLPPSWGSLSQVHLTSLNFLCMRFNAMGTVSTEHLFRGYACQLMAPWRSWQSTKSICFIALPVELECFWSCNACATGGHCLKVLQHTHLTTFSRIMLK